MTTTTKPRKRHWLRWTLIGAAALVMLIAGVSVLAIAAQSAPAPLALPSPAAAPVGPLDGTWQPTDGTIAGFRIQQTVIGMTSDVVGRTTAVTGSVLISGGQVTTTSLTINLLDLTSGDKPVAPQFATSLNTARYPQATAELTEPVDLGDGFASGDVAAVTVAGRLTLRGVTHPVTVALSLVRDGARIAVTGTVPVTFADYGLDQPKGYGSLGSLADHGVAEFLLVLRPS
jgi:polyisoprenoid-binding protein YceI